MFKPLNSEMVLKKSVTEIPTTFNEMGSPSYELSCTVGGGVLELAE